MATKKPVVLYNGELKQIQAGDIIEGITGTDTLSASNEEDTTITEGQVVYISNSGNVKLATSAAQASARAVGFVKDTSISSASSGTIQTSSVFAKADWTGIADSTTLTAGSIYFLSDTTPGSITTTAPITSGSYITKVGVAISTTELQIAIENPIGL